MLDLLRRALRDDPTILRDPMLSLRAVAERNRAEAAQRQGKYAQLHEALLALHGDTPQPVLQAEAKRLGLDWARLCRDLDDPAVQARIDHNLRLAQSLGIQGTPALVVGDVLVPRAV